MRKILFVFGAIILILFAYSKNKTPFSKNNISSQMSQIVDHPLAIETMRKKSYPGSDIVIEEKIGEFANYSEYIASYKSEGLRIYALLTIPKGQKPKMGWPIIVFNHGYIAPEQYVTTERYVAYVEGFAANGYVVFKPDYRGNGKSEGEPEGAYYSPAYATDILNAVASVKKMADVDATKIGMWGHSLGGNIALRDLEVSSDIKAAVIWAGVVGSYDDLMNHWTRRVPFVPSQRQLTLRNRGRESLTNQHGTPQSNPTFWDAIDPSKNLMYVNVPVQLNHGESDEEVPVEFSQKLYAALKSSGKTVEFYSYPGADHNISGESFNLAMQRSLEFFNKYLKS